MDDLVCRASVELLAPSGALRIRLSSNAASIRLVHSADGQLCIRIGIATRTLTLPVRGLTIFKRYLCEGRATIVLRPRNVQLLLHHPAAPSALEAFLRTLVALHVPQSGNARGPASLEDAENREPRVVLPSISRCQWQQPDVRSCAGAPSNTDDHQPLGGDDLCEEQQRAVAAVRAGRSVFISGAAGTGKSHLLRHLIRLLPRDRVRVCSSRCGPAAVGD